MARWKAIGLLVKTLLCIPGRECRPGSIPSSAMNACAATANAVRPRLTTSPVLRACPLVAPGCRPQTLAKLTPPRQPTQTQHKCQGACRRPGSIGRQLRGVCVQGRFWQWRQTLGEHWRSVCTVTNIRDSQLRVSACGDPRIPQHLLSPCRVTFAERIKSVSRCA